MNETAMGLQKALLMERKKTYIENGSCDALPGECRFLWPYNSNASGFFWDAPTPEKRCASFNCPFFKETTP